MSNLQASTAHIIQWHIADLMAEVSCASSEKANQILVQYPEYREAKGNPSSPFWSTSASKMRESLQACIA